MSLSINIGRPILNDKTLDEQARSILRLYGTNAHVYLPGANGVAVSGLNSGNYVESTFNTLASVDSVVGGVRDPLGSIDATQFTTANKPAMRRGLYNLALSSQNLVNAAWVPVGDTTVTANRATFPTGGVTNPLRQSFSFTSGTPYTIALDCKAISGVATGTLDLQNIESGTFTAPATRGIVVYNVTPGAARTWLDIQLDGAGVVDVYAFGIFAGTLTAAQILAEGGIPLTTSTAASNSGVGGYSWQFDGVNDSLYATTAPFNQNDDWFMCAAFRCDSAAGYNVALACAVDATSKGPKLLVLQTTGYAALEMSDGTTSFTVADTVSCIGQVVVIWATQVAGVRKVWKNGTLLGTNSTALSPTTCVGLRIGASGTGAGSPFNGMLGPQMAHKGTFTDADALTLARMVAFNTPAAPTF